MCVSVCVSGLVLTSRETNQRQQHHQLNLSDPKRSDQTFYLNTQMKLTLLCANSKQVYDVLVFVHHFHQLHLRYEVCQVFVCGII